LGLRLVPLTIIAAFRAVLRARQKRPAAANHNHPHTPHRFPTLATRNPQPANSAAPATAVSMVSLESPRWADAEGRPYYRTCPVTEGLIVLK